MFKCVDIISRSEWKARQPKLTPTQIPAQYSPVPYVFIHHTVTSPSSPNYSCTDVVLNIQHFHQDDRGWDDIGYNFLISPAGEVFEGRGWGIVGAHVKDYNSKSVGISFIGNFNDVPPSPEALSAAQRLIQQGVTENHIASNYVLKGHRQARNTECPGDLLYKEIQEWPHWEN